MMQTTRATFQNMYYYPIFLLTEDAARNRMLADLLANEQKRDAAMKLEVYGTLPASAQHKALYDLVDLEKSMITVVVDILRADYNVLNTNLPDIDHWRLQEKAKRLLSMLKSLAERLVHPYQEERYAELIRDAQKWDVSTLHSPAAWNDLILMRVSDIHRHVTRLVDNVRVTIPYGQDAETLASIGTFLESWRAIAREVKDYTRLVSSL
jgi:hypothetical protein